MELYLQFPYMLLWLAEGQLYSFKVETKYLDLQILSQAVVSCTLCTACVHIVMLHFTVPSCALRAYML